MRPALWAIGNNKSSAQRIATPPSGGLLLSRSIPTVFVGTSASKFMQPAQRDMLLTTSAPVLKFGIGLSPPTASLNLTTYVINQADPWSADFSSDFGPFASVVIGTNITVPVRGLLLTEAAPTVIATSGTIIIPPSVGLLFSLSAPQYHPPPATNQFRLTTTAPLGAIGRSVSPPVRSVLLTTTAPRVLPGVQIKPASRSLTLTAAVPTVSIAGVDYSNELAWTAHTFVVGERCLNQGLAYQCITAGVSTIAPTGTSANFHMGTDGAFFEYIGVANKTFNVHQGLAAWTNHTFAVGERCSSVGNAYQAINGGTSTAAPNGTSASVNNGGACNFVWLSAIDFATPQAWADFMNTTFGAPGPGLKYNPTVRIWNDGVYTTALNTPWLSYFNIAANGCSTLITTGIGESFRDKVGTALAFNAANGVAFDTATSGTETTTALVYVNVANVTFEGLQLRDTNPFGDTSDNGNILVGGDVNSAGLTIRNCILDGRHLVYLPANNCKVYNNLVISRLATQPDTLWPIKWDISATGGVFVNNTCIGVSGTGTQSMVTALGSFTGQVTVRNCAFFGLANPLFCQNILGAIIVDHCCTDVANFSGTAGFGCTDNGGEQFSKTAANQFVSATTDFHLKTGSSCIANGVVDTTDIPAGDDIFGLARGASWDIGAAELAFSMLPARASLTLTPTAPTVTNSGAAAITLDPANKGADIALSGGNLIGAKTITGANDWENAKATVAVSAGKRYFEFSTTVLPFSGFAGIGLSNASLGVNGFGGAGTNGIMYVNDGRIFYNNVAITTIDFSIANDILGMAFDVPNALLWIKNITQGGFWNMSAPANPATGVGGIAIGVAGNLFATAMLYTGFTESFNFGPSYVGAVPAGFSSIS